MKKVQLLIVFLSAHFSTTVFALSPEAIEGKVLYPTCLVCHNPELKNPLGPPMWGVQRRYKKNSLDKEDFIQSMVEFVRAPTLEKAIHDEALGQLGLMPAMPLPDELLKKISTYIFEEQFPAPCAHWTIAVNRATERGDAEHAIKDQRMLKRFCG